MNDKGISKSIYEIRLLDSMSLSKSWIHSLHPLINCIVTICYLIVVVSFDAYEVSRLLPMLLFPIIIFAVSDLPVMPLLKRVVLVEPLFIGIGILNPILDQSRIMIGAIEISGGWLTFASIILKCSLTVTAALLLMATTGMDRLAAAMRMLMLPGIFVLQLVLTYRYIMVLMEEVLRGLQAYFLRAPGQKGVQMKAWGPFAGQLLLRSFDRAQRVYQAMKLRGFNGEYNTGMVRLQSKGDLLYLFCWIGYFAVVRFIDLPALIGTFFMGV